MEGVEEVVAGDVVLAYVFAVATTPIATSFVTTDNATFQAGFVVYPTGGEVTPHVHLPVVRTVTGTAELLLVRSGQCLVDIYDNDRRLVATRTLGPGDAVLSLAGGHGFRMLQDTVLFEVKQGPYVGGEEKARFKRPEGEP